jgi:hypothetical protein
MTPSQHQKTNLALFFDPRTKAVADIEEIAAHIGDDIKFHPFPTSRPHLWTPLRLFTRPTVTVEFDRPQHFNLIRGRRLRQLPRGKIYVTQKLRDAGLPVPMSEIITPQTILDPTVWGPYVVVKPDLGGRGAYVWIQRTGRVRHKESHELQEDHPGRHGLMIAEQFIYTGRWPVSYRVLTLFGEPLLSARYEGRHNVPPLEGPANFRRAGGGIPIVATAEGCTISLNNDPEILALARQVHAVFPKVPLLGQDIVRDTATGRLYVLEVNPNGGTWGFSNPSGRKIQADFRLDFYRQFDGLKTAARVLSEVARRFAQ